MQVIRSTTQHAVANESIFKVEPKLWTSRTEAQAKESAILSQKPAGIVRIRALLER